MTTKASSGSSIGLTCLLAIVAVLAWWWRATLLQTQHPTEARGEAWEHVKAEYPIPPEPAEAPTISTEQVDSILRANPFSQKRRLAPPSASSGASGDTEKVTEPPKPAFVYKGRVVLGTRQRAIVEETSMHKTYFLEVGQEVAGFKVLDIFENRVVLSDSHTNEQIVVSLSTSASPTSKASGGTTQVPAPPSGGVQAGQAASP